MTRYLSFVLVFFLIFVATVMSTTEANDAVVRRRTTSSSGDISNLHNNNNLNASSNNLNIRYDGCDPCIDRLSYRIKVITHGMDQSSSFWKQLRALQAAADLRVEIEFDLGPGVVDDATPQVEEEEIMYDGMAKAILQAAAASTTNSYHALLVTVPSLQVRDAVQRAHDQYGIPIVGLQSNHVYCSTSTTSTNNQEEDVVDDNDNSFCKKNPITFVGMDDYQGGWAAAKQFLQTAGTRKRTLFVTSTTTTTPSSAQIRRLKGLRDGLSSLLPTAASSPASSTSTGTLFLQNGTNFTLLGDGNEDPSDTGSAVVVEELSLNMNFILDGNDLDRMELELNRQWEEHLLLLQNLHNDDNTVEEEEAGVEQQEVDGGCPYDAILLSVEPELFEQTLHLLHEHGCQNSETTSIGTFDTSKAIYEDISIDYIQFAISQQPYLQGSLATALATLLATTGKQVNPASSHVPGLLSTGPRVINFDNLPLDAHQICEMDAFPVCPNTKVHFDGTSEAQCACIDRSNLKLGGVTHGLEIDPFWMDPQAFVQQAATDLGVVVEWDLIQDSTNAINDDVTYAKMSNQILSMCRQGYNGVFVSFANDAIVPAIQECQKLEIPLVSINSGSQTAQALGILHIGQHEYQAGYEAGKQMVQDGMVVGLCPNPRPASIHLARRCQGFRDAIMEERNITGKTDLIYLESPPVPADTVALYIQNVEEFMELEAGYTGDWDSVGILMVSAFMLPEAVGLRERHPALRVATFDKSEPVFDAIRSGQILFGIDQGSSLQGYLPVWLLSLMASTKQCLLEDGVATGPVLLESPPSTALQVCESKLFEVCPPPVYHDYNQLTPGIRAFGFILLAIVWFTSAFFAVWGFWNRKNPVVSNSQPVFLMIISCGTFIMGSAIIPLSIDDGVASVEAVDVACMATPWLLTFGWSISFAGIICKLMRINKIVSNAAQFRRTAVTVWHVLLPLGVLILITFVLMLTWTLIDPMKWQRTPDCGSFGESSYGVCLLGEENASKILFGLVLSVNLCAMILANVEAFKARKISLQFSESKFIFMIMIGLLQTSVIGLPVIALVNSHPVASFFVKSAMIFVVCMTILLLLLVPKMVFMRREKMESSRREQQKQGDRTSMGNSDGSFQSSSKSRISKTPVPKAFRAEPEDTFLGSLTSHRTSLPGGVGMSKIVQMDELLKDQGVNTDPLWTVVGIELPGMRNRKSKAPVSFSTKLVDAHTPSISDVQRETTERLTSVNSTIPEE